MKTAKQNYRMLQEIDANRTFLLTTYQQNPKLLDRADARFKQMYAGLVPHDHSILQSAPSGVEVGVGDKQRGFTLIELIAVMVIVGILAAFAAPRMFNANAFQSRGFSDQVQATLRYAQKIAIAQRRNVCVAMTATSVTLTIATVAGAASACVNPLPLPQGGNSITTPVSTITLTSSSANFIFNGLGSTTAQTISVLGEANAIVVEAETGYVHSP